MGWLGLAVLVVRLNSYSVMQRCLYRFALSLSLLHQPPTLPCPALPWPAPIPSHSLLFFSLSLSVIHYFHGPHIQEREPYPLLFQFVYLVRMCKDHLAEEDGARRVVCQNSALHHELTGQHTHTRTLPCRQLNLSVGGSLTVLPTKCLRLVEWMGLVWWVPTRM